MRGVTHHMNQHKSEADLNRYIALMRYLRSQAMAIYDRILKRLDDEEILEAQHAALRAAEGKLPTTAVTRALIFHMRGIPVALMALNLAIRTVVAEGKVLGLEHMGQAKATMHLEEKAAQLRALMHTPCVIEVRRPNVVPDSWWSAEIEE
jgi:hypothetical protein